MEIKSLHPKHRLASFGYALEGLRSLVSKEPNAKLHLIATALVLVAGFLRHLSPERWALLLLGIGGVWIAEAFNTCIEMLCDLWCKGEIHPAIKRIKDIAAGAVLLAAMTAVGVGVAVFFF